MALLFQETYTNILMGEHTKSWQVWGQLPINRSRTQALSVWWRCLRPCTCHVLFKASICLQSLVIFTRAPKIQETCRRIFLKIVWKLHCKNWSAHICTEHEAVVNLTSASCNNNVKATLSVWAEVSVLCVHTCSSIGNLLTYILVK